MFDPTLAGGERLRIEKKPMRVHVVIFEHHALGQHRMDEKFVTVHAHFFVIA